MTKNIFLLIIVVLLNSCQIHVPQALLLPELPPPAPKIELLAMPPKLNSIDWEVSFYPLVKNMRSIDYLNEGSTSTLLVNNIQNATNGSLQSYQATTKLKSLIKKCSHFNVITAEAIQNARMKLGLSDKDSLESRNKALELARCLNAQYILYCIVSGNIQQPNLDMQLMRIPSGEIVWSCQGLAHE